MKKILASLLVFNSFVVFTEEREEFGLFEKYYESKPLLSRLTGSNRGTRYIGRLSDDKNPSLSLSGYMKYGIMKCACKLGYTAGMDDESNGKHVSYMCSRDLSIVTDNLNLFKEMIHANMRAMGETLKQGQLVSYTSSYKPIDQQNRSKEIKPGEETLLPADKYVEEFIFVSCTNLSNSNIDPMQLGYVVNQKIQKSEFGLFLIDGYLIKIIAVPNQGTIKVSEILATPKEIAEAKSILSK